MKRKKTGVKSIDDQPYKVGKPFIKWLDGQIEVMQDLKVNHYPSRWEELENEITLEAYQFIGSIVKP